MGDIKAHGSTSKKVRVKVDVDIGSFQAVCDFCGKGFANETYVNKHKKDVHTEVNQEHQQCPKCPKSFNNMRRFWNHVILVHEAVGGVGVGSLGGGDDEEDEEGKPRGKTATDPKVEALWKMSANEEPTCIQCNKSFASRDGVRKHIRQIHLGRKRAQNPCECPKCGKKFVERNRLNKHLRTVHKLSETDFPCNLCSIVLCSADGLMRHKKNFHGVEEEPPPIDTPPTQCPYCDEVFQHQGYEAHIRTLHSEHYEEYMKSTNKSGDKQSFTCPTCGETFADNRIMRRHISRLHNPDGRYQCSECGKTFGDQKELENHMAVHQNSILEPYVKAMLKTVFGVICQTSLTCGLCQTIVYSSAEAKLHLYIKHPETFHEMVREKVTDTSLICTVCNERKETKEEMINHMELNHPEQTVPTCGFCGHKELKEREMNFHYKRFHPTDSQARHVCEVCQASFTQKRSLVHHVKRHSDSAEQCPYCPERHIKVKSHVTRKHPDRAEEYTKLVKQAIKKEREARKRFNQFLEGKPKKRSKVIDKEQASESNGSEDELSENEEEDYEEDEEMDMKPTTDCIVKATKQVSLEKYTIEKRVEQPHVIEIQRIAPPVPSPEPEQLTASDDDDTGGAAVDVDIKPNVNALNANLNAQLEDDEQMPLENEVANEEAETEEEPQNANELLCDKEVVIKVNRLTESEIDKWTSSSIATTSPTIEVPHSKNVAAKRIRKRRRRRY
ncbi:unnamed protein product [Orchesella dallaii]|uniref:C2H2-type domain-containing protein n=1 Tax=Orchesella dallaii TaxID=48710 RepID=A0ABP1RCP8_9HEXA